jgi:rfaE bifunctional protein nucleotidyltransferase chain/domain/rfaE bifunctional protein kinase chain/domain
VLDLTALVDRFRGLEVVVLGDAVLDAWLDGNAERLCREGPAPVVDVSSSRLAPGGAANAAANLAALGARPYLVAAIGEDADGRALCNLLHRAGVDVSGVLPVPGRVTPTKRRLTAGGQLVARFDETPDDGLPAGTAQAVAEALYDRLPGRDLLLVSDYGLGSATGAARSAVERLRPRTDVLVVDARDPRPWAGTRPTAATPNAEEAQLLLDASGGTVPPGGRAEHVLQHADALLERTGADMVAATVDAEGAVLLRPGLPPHRVRVRPAAETTTTGAGDSFAAALLLALGVGADPAEAANLAASAADCVLHAAGTLVCGRSALLSRLRQDPAGPDPAGPDPAGPDPAGPDPGELGPAPDPDRGTGRVLATEELVRLVDRYRRTGRRIVFTNGCFDVLHTGHVAYLEEARRLGDVLVVGLNSDASVARLKGADRPVNSQEDRAALLAALQAVDHVTVFDEDSPAPLLERVRPDVYAKGGDYTPEMLPETPLVRQLGGEVRTLGYLSRRSSSRIIDRIRAGAEPR